MFEAKTRVYVVIVFGLGFACTIEEAGEDRRLQSAEQLEVAVESIADQPLGQGVDPNDCCLFQQTPGCDDAEIEACVCAFDPFCCTVAWDGFCISEAISDCGLTCDKKHLRDNAKPDGGDDGHGDDGHDDDGHDDDGHDHDGHDDDGHDDDGHDDDGHDDDGHDDDGHDDGKADDGYDQDDCFDDCCTPNEASGCENSEIEQCVCAFDGFCCLFLWDWQCVEGAIEHCGAKCE